MQASVRPYVTAGVALVGASVVAVSPITPSAPQIRTVDSDVSLAAASVFNVPANAFNAFLNMPGAMLAGIERFAAAMEASGSWNESHPNNVWGWDQANPEHARGLTDIFVPVPAISTPLGEHINWWMAANLPMHEGCAFACPDLAGMLGKMFKVPMWEFWDADGYTFPEVINPVSGEKPYWSGVTVKLDPWEPVTSFVSYLMSDPGVVRFPTAYEFVTGFANLASALQTTGHLPTWIAVREIETFVKLFLPKPATPSPAPNDSPESLSTPPSDSLRLVTLNTADLQADSADAQLSDAPVGDRAVSLVSIQGTDADSSVSPPSTGPSGTVDVQAEGAAPVPAAPADTQTVDADPQGDAAAVADSETRPAGGKHRKPTKLSGLVKSATDRLTGAAGAGKTADDDASADQKTGANAGSAAASTDTSADTKDTKDKSDKSDKSDSTSD
jgi:hypothetical protein